MAVTIANDHWVTRLSWSGTVVWLNTRMVYSQIVIYLSTNLAKRLGTTLVHTTVNTISQTANYTQSGKFNQLLAEMGPTTYRVAQIKRCHFTFLLVANECIYKILWFLALPGPHWGSTPIPRIDSSSRTRHTICPLNFVVASLALCSSASAEERLPQVSKGIIILALGRNYAVTSTHISKA